jgi:hypothetical protein
MTISLDASQEVFMAEKRKSQCKDYAIGCYVEGKSCALGKCDMFVERAYEGCHCRLIQVERAFDEAQNVIRRNNQKTFIVTVKSSEVTAEKINDFIKSEDCRAYIHIKEL